MDTNAHRAAFAILLAVVSVAFIWLLLPFYGAILWAVILAIVFQPMQRYLERRLPGRTNAVALISVLACVCVAIIPMMLLTGSLVGQGASLYERMQSRQIDMAAIISEFRAGIPDWAESRIQQFGLGDFNTIRDKLAEVFMQGSQMVAGQAFNIGQNTLHFFVSAGIMLYLLFFFFRDGPRIVSAVGGCLPLREDYTLALLAKFKAVVRATVRGNIIIALIQGLIGGTAFWLLGIEAALLAGVLMAFLSLVPAVGAAIVWAPVAAYLLISGSIFQGLILIGVGAGVIGLVDNILRPPLVGKETRLPDYVVLVSTIGGMSILGINGFVLGPLIAALFISAWTLLRDEQLRSDPNV